MRIDFMDKERLRRSLFYACNQLWDELGCDIQTTKTKTKMEIAGEYGNIPSGVGKWPHNCDFLVTPAIVCDA